jgi:hypothetical protein
MSGKPSSIFPPHIASLKHLSKLQSQYPQAHPVIFDKMKSFYKAVPKGNAPTVDPAGLGPIGKYRYKYLRPGHTSVWPLLHIGIGVIVAYYIVDRHAKGTCSGRGARPPATRNGTDTLQALLLPPESSTKYNAAPLCFINHTLWTRFLAS